SWVVSARMIALIVAIIAWVLALASATSAWASSAISSPAGVARALGSFTMLMMVFALAAAGRPAAPRPPAPPPPAGGLFGRGDPALGSARSVPGPAAGPRSSGSYGMASRIHGECRVGRVEARRVSTRPARMLLLLHRRLELASPLLPLAADDGALL